VLAVAKLARDAAEERVRVLEARPGAVGSAAVEEIVGTLEAELRALQSELKALREKEAAGEFAAAAAAGKEGAGQIAVPGEASTESTEG
jgi:hypothetical protein